jgi:hypothetical protein
MSCEQSGTFARYRRKTTAAVGAFALAIGLSSCAFKGRSSAEPSPSSSPASSPAVTRLTPNMSGFLQPGSSTTCYNGGKRPCAVLIRTQPDLSSPDINTNPIQGHVSWPQEAYRRKLGNSLVVICYDPNGQRVAPYEGNLSSTDWLKVLVPDRHVRNPEVQAEIADHDPAIHTIRFGGSLAVEGWTSVEWFGLSAAPASVLECAPS